MKKKWIISILFSVIAILAIDTNSLGNMAKFCTTPPFLNAVVPANVLIILDNSGSMGNFAYDYNGKNISTGFDPSKIYYGYFDPTKKYSYNSSKGYFYENSEGKWDGNFLNWLTMRRIDIARKVLVGGKYDATTGVLIGEEAKNRKRGYKKKIKNAENYTPYTGTKYFYFNYGNFGTSKFKVCNSNTCSSYYNVKVKIDFLPKGIVQQVWNKVRLGLMFFNHGNKFEDNNDENDGGYIADYISGPGENANIVTHIENKNPNEWTPLAEALYEAIRYFKAYQSAYNSLNYRSYDPIQYWCQKNFVIIITDGESTKDQNIPGGCWGDPIPDANGFDVKIWMDKIANNEGYSSQKCKSLSKDGTYYLEGVSYYAHITDLRDDLPDKQSLNIYTILAFTRSTKAKLLLKKTAKYGGFIDSNGNNKPDLQSEWDKDEDGIPDNYFEAQNGYQLENALLKAFISIFKHTSSGTSVSVLTARGLKGSSMVQAVFYPQKYFGDQTLNWVGYLYDYWLYTSSTASNIREDTIQNKALDVCSASLGEGGDYILDFKIDNSTGDLKIDAYNSACNGTATTKATTYNSLDELHPVWEAGDKLAETNATSRKIYTSADQSNLLPGSPKSLSQLSAIDFSNAIYTRLLGDENGDGTIDDGNETHREISTPIGTLDLIDYLYGVDLTGYRNRTTDTGKIWKLGDIIYSTPQVVQYFRENTASRTAYNVVYVGANDGMLHAFRLGQPRFDRLAANQVVKLCNNSPEVCSVSELGQELWAFVPKNALPYLRYLADPDYCHLYYVDLEPYIVKIDENKDQIPEKVILIGGMRFGGAVGCKDTDCVNPPLDTCPDPSNSTCVGLSSYFALDVTDPENPKFLWEFTDPDLGFTYSGPAVITYNGTRYVMFLSGPTDYQGDAGQSLKAFVLELNNDFTVKATYKFPDDYPSGNPNSSFFSSYNHAFGGRLFTNGIDYNEDGNTDMVAFGITQKTESTWQGNLGAVKITGPNPTEWQFTSIFNSAIKPITAKVEYMKCFGHHFLYFGTGRWFFKTDEPGQNINDTEKLYGVLIDGCLTGNNCNINRAKSSDQVCNDLPSSETDLSKIAGWYQELDPKNETYFKERLITDPTPTEMDIILFTTMEPTSDICGYGGRSRVWALNCATGGSLTDTSCPGYGVAKGGGTIYLQLSRGNIEEFKLSPESFSQEGGKATSWQVGVPPESPTQFLKPFQSAEGHIIYWFEK